MKCMVLTILNVMLLWGVCSAGEKLDLSDAKVRVSYSVGYQMGGDFKRQGVDINPELVLKGIQDALAGNEPLMTMEEMRTSLVDLQKTVTAAQKKKEEEAARNLAEGRRFLVENGKKEGVVTLASGLQYKVIEEGFGRTPGARDKVTVHYRGKLIDGSEFDSSYSRNKPAIFQTDQVIAGWKEALLLMKEGAKWLIFVPPGLAYGEQGAGSKIGPNSTLIFEVSLISAMPAE